MAPPHIAKQLKLILNRYTVEVMYILYTNPGISKIYEIDTVTKMAFKLKIKPEQRDFWLPFCSTKVPMFNRTSFTGRGAGQFILSVTIHTKIGSNIS